MRSVRIIFAGLLCVIVSSSRADIASVQYVESVIPTVNDATLTIQKNGSTVDTFTANSASNKTVNITVPTTAADVSAVPTTRTVNTKALSSDVTLSGGDIAVTGYSKPGETGAIEATDTVNAAIGKLEKALDAKQASGSYVPTTTTVNAKALSSDITLDGADVKVTGYAKADSAAAVTANDTVNQAIGKLEKALDGKQASGDYVQTTRTVNSKALSSDITLSASDVGAVPTSRTVNTKALSSDVTLNGGDIAVTGYSKPSETGAIEATDTVNAAIGKLEKALEGKQASGSYVPTTTTVNSKALSSNITLDGADVALTGYSKAANAAAVAASDTVNQAIGKSEKALDGKQASGDYVVNTTTVNGHALSSNVTVSKSDVGLGNVANVDTTNASNISSGTLDVARLPVGTTSTTVAAGNDARFNTIATSQPSGTPPTGTVFIWFDSGN